MHWHWQVPPGRFRTQAVCRRDVGWHTATGDDATWQVLGAHVLKNAFFSVTGWISITTMTCQNLRLSSSVTKTVRLLRPTTESWSSLQGRSFTWNAFQSGRKFRLKSILLHNIRHYLCRRHGSPQWVVDNYSGRTYPQVGFWGLFFWDRVIVKVEK